MLVTDYKSDDDDSSDPLITWQQEGSGHPDSTKTNRNPIKAYAEDRQRKLLSIIMKLALVKGYNNLGNIKLTDGTYLPKSDVTPLLLYVLSRDKPVTGISEFIELLREAGVTPDMVTNEGVKQKLQGTHSSFSQRPHVTYEDEVMHVDPDTRKRQREEDAPPPPLSGPFYRLKRKRAIRPSEKENKRIRSELIQAQQTPLPYESDSNDDDYEQD